MPETHDNFGKIRLQLESHHEVPLEWYLREMPFGATTSAGPTHSFINLKQLLQVSDNDKIILPTVYIDDLEEDNLQKAITFPKPLLQITDKPSILESLDVSEYLVLRAKDAHSKPTEVRGGPKDALIVYATQPVGSLLYQEAFLTTYRGFVSSLELIQKLVRRYLFMNLSKELNEIRAARQTFSVLVRVVDELCATELTLDLISMVTSFVYRLIRDGNYDFARLLRKRLMERIQEKAPINLNNSDSSNSDLFHKIEPAEMLWWAKEQDPAKSPNVVIFTEHFNKISYWVRTHVLLPNEHREREKYFLKFIKIMKQLRKMGNLSSYLAILSALDSGPVRRLDWSKSLKEQLNEHTDIIDSKMSFKNYRAVLAETQPPCLPYIGLILQDLTFVDVGNPDYLSPAMCNNRTNLLNYGKRWQQFAILDNVRRFKSWTYNIQRDEKVHRLFNGFANCLGEEEAWTRSLEIKPRKPSGRN
uniref:Ras-GEF domain-containing protein n=2 Tax=Panagrolaimus superbus TaxID=310955 RepID=A0A914YKY3_9BILA